jgi:hypothetical protein
LKNKIENYKNFDKRAKKNNKKNQKKRDQIKFIIIIEKTKTIKDKIVAIKTLTKG